MLLCRELVPSSTWCFVFTLNSFRLCSWLPSLTQISPVEKREVNWCLPSSQVHPSPTYTLLLSSSSTLLQSAAHSSSCQGEAVLHGEAPMPLSNFTLEWSWAEHANPDITKQIKSRGWAQRRGRVLRMLGWKRGGEGRGGEGGGGAVVNWAEQLSACSDQDILWGESLIGLGWREALEGDHSGTAGLVLNKSMMVSS